MAVYTYHPSLLVNIGFKLVKFYTIGSEKIFMCGVGCTVLIIEVMFVPSVVVKTDMIAIVAG
jgi:hypothetical protein